MGFAHIGTGADLRRCKITAHAGKLAAYKAIVKVDVMRRENGRAHEAGEIFGNLLKSRRVLHHVIGYAGQPGNEGRDSAVWVYQSLILINDLSAFDFDRADFRNAMFRSAPACGFNINHHISLVRVYGPVDPGNMGGNAGLAQLFDSGQLVSPYNVAIGLHFGKAQRAVFDPH